jgi:sulfite exporter TauE/SafE
MSDGTNKSRTTFRQVCRALFFEGVRTAAFALLPIVAGAVGAAGWTVISGQPSSHDGSNFGFGLGILGSAAMIAGVFMALWFGFREIREADQARAAKLNS